VAFGGWIRTGSANPYNPIFLLSAASARRRAGRIMQPMKINSSPRFRWTLGSALLLAFLPCARIVQAEEPAPPRAFEVIHFTARLDPDLQAKTLRGTEKISLVPMATGIRDIAFDAGSLVIDEVRRQGKKLAFERTGTRLDIRLPDAVAVGRRIDIDIEYHGAPQSGLEFHPEADELYTIFSTSDWLVCLDTPEQRATLDLSVALPADFKATGNGRLVSKTALGNHRQLYRWRQDVPVPSFVYGFAAGKFNEADTRAGGIELRFLSHDLQPDQLHQVFADTADVLKFFGDRAGIPYRGKYDQALVTETIGQELAGFALLPEAYGRDVLEKPVAEDLMAHEAAHQWWGIMVTCRSWNDFWLNEGFADFMAAAYIQHRFGDAAYREIVEHWHQRVQRLVAAGKDHSLVYPQWNHPSRDDRAVVYQKGAYVLHLLREQMGERDFWNGIRSYTQEFRGRSVTTADFKSAMERSSGRNLDGFFRQWVTGNVSNGTAPVVSAPSAEATH
jgi:aminopeptidase N